MTESEVQSRRSKLAADLDNAIEVLGSSGKRNYFAAFSLVFLGIGASIGAGILSFLGSNNVVVGVLALIPAMCTILVSRLKLQERANWYYRKRTALYALYNELHFELPDPPTSPAIAEISKKWSVVNGEMEDAWQTSLAISVGDVTKTSGNSSPAKP